jgi:WhiB family transcriptional regulator, redox-sensing transcriptional regulator
MRDRYSAFARPQRRTDDEEDWQARAACDGHPEPDIWHAVPTSGRAKDLLDFSEAQRVCKTSCEVRLDCLRYALVTRQPHGTWGGLASNQRARVRTLR